MIGKEIWGNGMGNGSELDGNSEFYPSKIVIFHSFVSLPEDI